MSFAFILLVGVVGLAGEPPREDVDHESILELFKVTTDGGLLLLPVEIRGKRYWFALDTGMSLSCYDKSFRPLLGEQIRSVKMWTAGPHQEAPKPSFRSPACKVGRLALPVDSEVFCLDLEKTREWSGQKVHGFLGMDFLRKHVFRIDFDRGEVAFLRSVGPNPGERVPVLMRGNNPHVKAIVEVPGFLVHGHFHVDTGYLGFGSGSLQAEVFDVLAKREVLKLDGQPRMASLLGGSWTARTGWVGAISLGDYRHEKMLFAESKINILGLGYWSRYVVTFDFPHNAIYLKKGRQFDRPDQLLRDKSGLNISHRKGQMLVDTVEEGSPAAQAGVKPQDVLLKIDTANTSDMSLVGLRRLLCSEDKKCRLLIRRDEKELETTIVLHH